MESGVTYMVQHWTSMDLVILRRVTINTDWSVQVRPVCGDDSFAIEPPADISYLPDGSHVLAFQTKTQDVYRLLPASGSQARSCLVRSIGMEELKTIGCTPIKPKLHIVFDEED